MVNSFLCFIDRVCQPNILLFPNALQRNVLLKRNKRALLAQAISFITLILCILILDEVPSTIHCISLLAIICLLLIFFVCCRSYPTIFKIVQFLVALCLGPLFCFWSHESASFNLLTVFLCPLWTLCLSGDRNLFITQVIAQTFWLHFLYKTQLFSSLSGLPHLLCIHRITNIITVGIIVSSAFILIMELALIQTNITSVEPEQDSTENQRTMLLTFSHELRNLLGGITGTIKVCLQEQISTKAKELLTTSQICSELLNHLVNNLLDIGKAEVRQLEVVPSMHTTNESFQKIWRVCSHLIRSKNLRGRIEISQSVPYMMKIDDHRMTQILLNLVGNAIKFTDQGSIQVRVSWLEGQHICEEIFKPETPQITLATLFQKDALSISQDGGFNIIASQLKCELKKLSSDDRKTPKKGVLKITVTDSGCGIASEDVTKLFSKFSQVNRDKKKTMKGTGLGLFITKQLLHKMGGDIKVFSEVGKGSSFVACIPIETAF